MALSHYLKEYARNHYPEILFSWNNTPKESVILNKVVQTLERILDEYQFNWNTTFLYNKVFPPIFVTSLFNFRKCVFNFVPDTPECANARFNFVFGRSILKHCHSISCLVTRFRHLQFKFVSHSSWARESKSNFVYSFSSKFQSKSSPRCKGPITLDEFECQNNEFVWKNDEFDPCIRNSLSERDEFQRPLTNLNAEFLNLIDKKRVWVTIWRNWTLDLNAVSFSGRNWIENWWNWMKRWRKWAGKPIYM